MDIQNTKQDKAVIEGLILNNLKLIHSVCHKINSQIEYDDMFQSGCLGLIKAARTYKSNYGYAFSSYAIPVIRNEIRMMLRRHKNYIYLNELIATDENGNILTLFDMLESNDDIEQDVLDKIELQEKTDMLKSRMNK